MSGPMQTLDKANRLASGKRTNYKPVITHSKPKMSVLKCNDEEIDTITSNEMTTSSSNLTNGANLTSWTPPANWMLQLQDDGFITDEENYAWRRSRALMTLKYLLENTDELIKQPSQYIFDIRWFRYLSSKKHCKVDKHWAESQEDFVNEGLPKLFKIFWTEHLLINNMERWGQVDKDSVEALYHMTMALWFISTNPTHQKQMFLELCKFVMTMISGRGFERVQGKVKRVQDCLKALLGIIFQFVKNIDEAKDLIRECGGIGDIQIINASQRKFNRNVKGRAVMILAYLLNEEEQKNYKASFTIIEFLTVLLKDCLTTADHRSPTFNYDALEILTGLNRLAVSDTNKVTINDNDGLLLYFELLEKGTLEEQVEACRGLWTLCFSELVATNILNNVGMMAALQKLTKSEHELLRIAASGCLWTVQQLKSEHETMAVNHSKGHVMISYSWSVQADAKELKQKLHASGYRVWMDIENMAGSTLSAMSQAIEKAAVVLILLNEKYKTSPACRAEAEYTYKLQREFIPLTIQPKYSPDGWLGMLIGIKIFYDFSNPDDKDAAYEQLIDNLGDRGKGPPIDDIEEPTELPKSQEPVQNTVVRITAQPPVRVLACKRWSEEKVAEWFQENNLEEVATRMGGEINGEILAELKYLLLQEPDHYYNITRQDLKLPTVTLLRLSASLRVLS